jgi:hypothetical protein
LSDLGLRGEHLVRQEFIECIVWSAIASGVLVLNRSAWRRDARAAVAVRVRADIRVAASG